MTPDPVTQALSAPSFPVYQKRLRVLGAWWCRGASGVGPEQLLPHEYRDRVRPLPGVPSIRQPLGRTGRPQ
jgi:hypothetical protein